MTPPRASTRLAGAFYLLSFASIPTLSLYTRIHDADFLTSTAPVTPVIVGGILEVIVAAACVRRRPRPGLRHRPRRRRHRHPHRRSQPPHRRRPETGWS